MFVTVVFFSPLTPKNYNFTAIFGEGNGKLPSLKLRACCENHTKVTILQDADVIINIFR